MQPGAYGLRFTGEPPRSNLMSEVSDAAPEVSIQRRTGTVEPPNVVTEDHATVPLINGGGLELDRQRRAATLTTPSSLSDDELAHPYLAPIAAVFSQWLGRAPFHAGAVLVGSEAWGIIGEREAGKSSLLAALAVAGHPVLADDLLVVDDGVVHAGPRTLDLREPAATHFGRTRHLQHAGARERWRLDLEPAPPTAPLAGWIIPQWSEEITVTFESAGAAIHHISPARSVSGLAIDPEAFMAAGARPVAVFTRPRRLGLIEEGVERLVGALLG